MLDGLIALVAFAEQGTMQRAARQLFITQSAVSKRIAQLEDRYGQKLIARDGRRVILTAAGKQLQERGRGLIADFDNIFNSKKKSEALSGTISIDFSMSALMSCGHQVLSKFKKKNPELELQISIYHSSIAIERVRRSATSLAVVLGSGRSAPDLIFLPLRNEHFVIVPSGLKPFKFKHQRQLPIIALESTAQDWMLLEEQIRPQRKSWGTWFKITRSLQSIFGNHNASQGRLWAWASSLWRG